MSKLIICDKNKKLIKELKKADIKPFRNYFEIEIIEGDVFDVKLKYPNAKICTASNPDFNPSGGLDKQLAEKYPEEWEEAKEFNLTNNLFFLISVDKEIKASDSIILRALSGVFSYIKDYDLILTGIGTAIGNFKISALIALIGKIFHSANLSYADLRSADLSSANLSSADLRSADLSSANLRSANLSYANLSSANLRSANLSYANLSSANLSSAKNIVNDYKKFLDNFKKTNEGLIVYKAIGNTSYPPNENWKIEEGGYLTENVNFNKTDLCGCGVNFGTLEFIKKEYPDSEIWECLIEFDDLVEVVIPYNTDGKARCGRLKLIKRIKNVK